MTGRRLIQGDWSARRYLHSDEVFRKETNWNSSLPNEREFKNGKCIVTDKDDTAYSIDELVSLLNEFQKENFQFKQQISEQAIQLDYLKNENQHMKDVLNENKELETRNKRQYDLLTEITDLMMKRDWKGLEKIVEDWEESDRLLQAEWGNCGDVE